MPTVGSPSSADVAVEELAEEPVDRQWTSPDQRGGTIGERPAARVKLAVGERVVLEQPLVGTPGALEVSEAFLPEVGPSEVEAFHACLTAPANRLEEQDVVRPLGERSRVGRTVLVGERALEGQEDCGSDRLRAVTNQQHESEVGRKEPFEVCDEVPRLDRYPLAPPRGEVEAVEVRQRAAVRAALDEESLPLGAAHASKQ